MRKGGNTDNEVDMFEPGNPTKVEIIAVYGSDYYSLQLSSV